MEFTAGEVKFAFLSNLRKGIAHRRERRGSLTKAARADQQSDSKVPLRHVLEVNTSMGAPQNILIAIIHRNHPTSSTISADLYRSYQCLKNEGYDLDAKLFNPKESPDHLKWLHATVSNLKALIAGTYHGLGTKHLQACFNEFCYRFNRRKFKGQLFNRLLNACVQTATITFRYLVDGLPEQT